MRVMGEGAKGQWAPPPNPLSFFNPGKDRAASPTFPGSYYDWE